jgi:hypothetical protein
MSATNEERRAEVRFTVVVQSRHTMAEGTVTGRQIKERAGIPPDFSLFRRAGGATDVVADDEQVVVRDGDHFFAQPPDQMDLGHGRPG